MLGLPGQGQIYIIVDDALDECPGTPSARENVQVLEFVEEIVGLKLPNVDLCVVSLQEMDIRFVLEPLTTIKVSLHDEVELNAIVRSDWGLRRSNEEDKQLVVDTLSSKADGMYVITCLVFCLRLHNERSHGLIGFGELSAKWTGCVALFLRVFGRS
jgi:hypothetical protein